MRQRISIKLKSTVKYYSSIILLSFSLISCGGGNNNNSNTGSGNGEIDPTILSVQINPADGATAVELNASISATFNKDVFAKTITNTNFTLTGKKPIPANVSYSETSKVARLTPTKDLTMLSKYTVLLSKTITDVSGTPLVAKNGSFTTRDGRWATTAKALVNNTNDAFGTKIATSQNGSTIAVWSQSDGKTYNIMANRFTPDSGWGIAEFIGSGAASVSNPEVMLDSNGNALAVWQQKNTTGTLSLIYASRFTITNNGTAGVWSTARIISDINRTNSAFTPKIAFDSNGNAIVVWLHGGTVDAQFNATLWANDYTTSGTPSWGVAKRIDSSFSSSEQHQVMFDSNNIATVIWRLSTPSITSTINIIRFASGTPLSSIRKLSLVDISKTSTGTVSSPKISGDSNGNLHAVWSYDPNTNVVGGNGIKIMTASYDSATKSWGAVKQLSSNTGNAAYPEISVDDNGDRITMWQQFANKTYSIWSSRFTAGKWVAAKLIQDTVGVNGFHLPKIVMDNNGNAVAVWLYDKAQVENIYFSRYLQSNDSWSTPIPMDTHQDSLPRTTHARLALGVDGSVMAVWIHGTTVLRRVYSNSFR